MSLLDKKKNLTSGLSNPCRAPSVQLWWQHPKGSQLHPLVKTLTTKTSTEFYSSRVPESTQGRTPEAIRGRCLQPPAPQGSATARANAAPPPPSASVNSVCSGTAQFMGHLGEKKKKRLRTKKSPICILGNSDVQSENYHLPPISTKLKSRSWTQVSPQQKPNRCGSMRPSSEITYPGTPLSSLSQALCRVNCYYIAFSSELMCPTTFCRAWEM